MADNNNNSSNNTNLDTSVVHKKDYSPSEEHQVRVAKVQEMRKERIEPWPQKEEITSNAKDILKEFTEGEEKEYMLAGRVMSLRWHGKTAFAHIQDPTGKIQVYFRQDALGDKKFEILSKFVDIGDIIWVKGTSFKTKMGEVTIKAQDFIILSKCLHPLPEKFHGLTDVEVRYRQRYLDLICNEESKLRYKKRSRIVSSIRHFLEEHGYMEVETPMLHPIPGGAAARPFITHHNALDSDFYLRIAPELYLKRLVIGGFERVFELNRNFRNEGISTRHNPEFTMLEFYTAHEDYIWAMDFVENMLKQAVKEACGTYELPFGDHIIDFSKPFERLNVTQALLKYSDVKEEDLTKENIDKTLKKYKVQPANKNASLGEKLFALFEDLVESKLIQPTYLIDFPIETSPLAKRDPNNPNIASRFELFIAGMEISNGFTELNDPFDQAERFREQVKAHEAGDQEAHHYDADFIIALEHGLPPTVGVGIGIDRLVMLLTNTTSIKDVILFPTLKKK